MLRLLSCIILHFTPHELHILISPHIYTCTLDRDKPELEQHLEQAQAEDINPDPKQGKPCPYPADQVPSHTSFKWR
jgi:hypothetical protein